MDETLLFRAVSRRAGLRGGICGVGSIIWTHKVGITPSIELIPLSFDETTTEELEGIAVGIEVLAMRIGRG